MRSKNHLMIGSPDHSGPKTVVIVGTARGGTSMVAGTVRELGINLGARLGENHEDPKFLPQDLDHIRSVIKLRNEELDTWGWKMPHSLAYLDEIEQDLRNPHIILVWRNPLAIALSQVNRTGAKIDNGLNFAADRLQQMVEKIQQLTAPMLLVNYEQGVRQPDDFIDMIAGFLGIEVTPEVRQNCLNFIDPDTGYKQVSQTYYEVEKITGDFPDTVEHIRVPRWMEEIPGSADHSPTNEHARFILRTGQKRPLPKEFVLRFENSSATSSKIQILFDFDWEFSRNLSFKDEVEPGVHTYRIITNGRLKRLGVIPSFTDNKSDLINVELRGFTQDE